MADRPIIFSAPMVRALLAGSKTMTRRILSARRGPLRDRSDALDLVRYREGDRLYVREALRWTGILVYDADKTPVDLSAMPETFSAGLDFVTGMFMPRWASRITLTVTDVSVERLQDITEADALAEGGGSVTVTAAALGKSVTAREGFQQIWAKIHGEGAWDANPWVMAMRFRVQRGNIDQVPA